jgi:hypothetical protein
VETVCEVFGSGLIALVDEVLERLVFGGIGECKCNLRGLDTNFLCIFLGFSEFGVCLVQEDFVD